MQILIRLGVISLLILSVFLSGCSSCEFRESVSDDPILLDNGSDDDTDNGADNDMDNGADSETEEDYIGPGEGGSTGPELS